MSAQDSINEDDLQLEEDIELYLNIALANGFSKGTANVSPGDMKKLKGLLAHYAKKAHPFTACVRDQKKHGLSDDHAKKRCAVLKDLIKGTTKWRSTERKKNLSEAEKAEFILDDYPEDDHYIEEFVDWALNLDDETVNMILTSNNNDDSESDMTEIDTAWTQASGFKNLKTQIELALNKNSEFGCEYWVEDMQADKALVCERGKQHYVVPFSVTKKGAVELEDEDSWTVVPSESVQLSDDNKEMVAELFFTDAGGEVDNDGLVWKTFLREGTWAYSPGSGTKLKKPLTITKSGKSDPEKLIISMAELKRNFDAGVIQHVTVPLSHDDKPHENTGFVKKLRYGKDNEGRVTLEAALDFTEPDIKGKIDRGTIPNVSGGIHFNYIDKEKGRKFTSALGHIALTPKPWLQGMAPFGVNASENLNVVGFSEEPLTSENIDEGGVEDNMTTIVEDTNTDTFLSELGLSEDEVKARLSRYEELEKANKQARIDEQVRKWQDDEKKSPAVVAAAKEILMADEGAVILNLSDDGKNESLTASDIVNRLVAASPELNLSEEVITEEEVAGEAPADDTTEENLSDEVKSEARRLFLYENYTEKDALAEALKRSSEKTA